MISYASRMRDLVIVLVALALVLGGTLCLTLGGARLESLPNTQGPPNTGPKPVIKTAPPRETKLREWGSSQPRVHCLGPRDVELGQKENHDSLHEVVIDNIPYPEPFAGSYDTVGLSQTWMTAADRYGPYGWGDDKPNHGRKRVAWSSIDWAALQNRCLKGNIDRFRDATPIRPLTRRFRMRDADEQVTLPVSEPAATELHVPRTAILFRAWEGYNYTFEDFVNLRAAIAETSLHSGGEYTVFMLVDVKDQGRQIFSSDEHYQRAVRELVPSEFQGMAVLFDETLLRSWYPGIGSHNAEYQIMQPLQLFAHFYPEFDHYWQLELDLRFTGHAGRYLAAMSAFAREQPRKQAIERSTWFYMPKVHGAYSDLLAAVNASLQGAGGLGWGMRIQDVEPIGPRPPVDDPLVENFNWGVGDEADFIALTPCAHVGSLRDWYWRHWRQGFKAGLKTPAWMCQPAMGRASNTLLRAVHHAQATQDLAIHSEATLSSFALWHGLKLVAPPHPLFQNPRWPLDKMNTVFNGPGAVESHKEKGMVGMAKGAAIYRGSPYDYITQSGSLWWTTPFPDKIYDAWMSRGTRPQNRSDEVPYVLWRTEDGDVYAPNMMLHPVKTNQNLPNGSGVMPFVAFALSFCLAVAGLRWWRRKGHSGYPWQRDNRELLPWAAAGVLRRFGE